AAGPGARAGVFEPQAARRAVGDERGVQVESGADPRAAAPDVDVHAVVDVAREGDLAVQLDLRLEVDLIALHFRIFDVHLAVGDEAVLIRLARDFVEDERRLARGAAADDGRERGILLAEQHAADTDLPAPDAA